MCAGAILLALEVAVELTDGIHNPEKELSAHLITAPKYFLTVQWSIGEVVGVEQAIALHTMPLLALMAARHRATSPWLCIAREQAGQSGEDHEMLFVLGV